MSSSSEFRPGVDVGARRSVVAQVRPARLNQSLQKRAISPERARDEAQAEGFSVGWAEGHRAAAAAVADQTAALLAQEQAAHAAQAARLDAALSALERAGDELARRSTPVVED